MATIKFLEEMETKGLAQMFADSESALRAKMEDAIKTLFQVKNIDAIVIKNECYLHSVYPVCFDKSLETSIRKLYVQNDDIKIDGIDDTGEEVLNIPLSQCIYRCSDVMSYIENNID